VCPAFGIQFVTDAPSKILLSVAISPITFAFPQLPAAPSMMDITFFHFNPPMIVLF